MIFPHCGLQFCVHFQLRGAQILDAVRLHKTGFPENVGYGEFWRRFRILSDEYNGSVEKAPGLGEAKSAVEDLLSHLDLDKAAVRMGNTQVRRDFVHLERDLSVPCTVYRLHFQSRAIFRLIAFRLRQIIGNLAVFYPFFSSHRMQL